MNVDKINTVDKLKLEGFEGVDSSLEYSLEYGIIWKDFEDSILFVYRISPGRFDQCEINKNINLQEDYSFMNFDEIASYCGLTKEQFFDLSLEYQIYEIVSYWGYEDVFGTSYYAGFEIK